MRKLMEDLREFEFETGGHIGERPQLPPEDVQRLRRKLIEEESLEVFEAMNAEDLVGIADGLVDLIYVAVGTAVAYGIDLAPIWEEVHHSNLQKTNGPSRADGKVLKPDNWIPPNVAGLIEHQILKEV